MWHIISTHTAFGKGSDMVPQGKGMPRGLRRKRFSEHPQWSRHCEKELCRILSLLKVKHAVVSNSNTRRNIPCLYNAPLLYAAISWATQGEMSHLYPTETNLISPFQVKTKHEYKVVEDMVSVNLFLVELWGKCREGKTCFLYNFPFLRESNRFFHTEDASIRLLSKGFTMSPSAGLCSTCFLCHQPFQKGTCRIRLWSEFFHRLRN